MPVRPSFSVRLGLLMVRTVLRVKASILYVIKKITPLGAWMLKQVLHVSVPLYRLIFALKRQAGLVYRPVKNRFMFFISNRASLYITAGGMTVIVGVTNIQVNAVRAEMDSMGEQSVLYALVTDTRNETEEEYVTFEDVQEENFFEDESQNTGIFAEEIPRGSLLALDVSAQETGILVPGGSQKTGAALAREGVPLRSEVITYTIAQGDTLSGIAEKFGISMNTILWANNLSTRSVLKLGQELTILPTSGVVHAVKSGDTLLAIAKKYNVDAKTITAYNNISSDTALRIGDTFIVPGGVVSAVAPRSTPTSVAIKDIFTPAPKGSGGQTTPSAGASMIWPTDLSYIVRGMSWTHTGYDIDCNGHYNGTSTNDNYAAADGTVRFAGSRGGYGNMVEIDHGNGLITRYGHFYSLYVKSGEAVSVGQALGRCGSTGNSSGTHLHFEVIDAATKKFLNPANYIRR